LNEDYYYVLKTKRSATDEEITTAFKKLALLHHPLKNPDSMQIHLDKFHKVCEAYEVLSNRKYILCNFRTAQWKAIYDQYGHAILKLGLLDEATGKRFGAYKYRGNCYQIFDWFFLRNNPFYDIADMEGEQPEEGSFMAEAQGLKPELPQMPTIEVEVPTTLQEFYNGCMKEICYEREKIVLDG
jgi:DnaJ-class molecular chaperone